MPSGSNGVFFIVTELDSTSLYVMRRHGTVKGLGHLYGHAPEVVQKAGEYFSGMSTSRSAMGGLT